MEKPTWMTYALIAALAGVAVGIYLVALISLYERILYAVTR